METCRTCAKCDFADETNNWLDLFHSKTYHNEMFHIQKEFDNWNLQIGQNDGLPQKICTDCFAKFCNVYRFHLLCQEAQIQLNNIFYKIESQNLSDEEHFNDLKDAEKLLNLNEKNQLHKHLPYNDTIKTFNNNNNDNEYLYNINPSDSNEENVLISKDGDDDLEYNDELTMLNDLNIINLNENVNNFNELNSIEVSKSYSPVGFDNNKYDNNESFQIAVENNSNSTLTTTTMAINKITLIATAGTALPTSSKSSTKPSTVLPPTDTALATSATAIPTSISTDSFHLNNFEINDFIEILNKNDNNENETKPIENYKHLANINSKANNNLNNLLIENKINNDNELLECILFDKNTKHLTTAKKPPNFNEEIISSIETNSLKFTCEYCYKAKHFFSTQKELLKHITAIHNSNFPYTCPHCQDGFQDAASRTVHIKIKHVLKRYRCDVCGKCYADRCNLEHHFEKFHSDIDFECKQCEKRFYSRKSLNYHMKWHFPELQLKCNYCDRLFINQRHLQCHEATHTGLRKNECCTFCGKTFIHLKTLRWHIFKQHGGEKPFKCGHCTETFTSYVEKRIHMLKHHLENLTANEKTECMICHKVFENETILMSHMQKDHQQTRREQNLIITNNKRVLQHKRERQYSGLFQCNMCSQRFNMKKALERHAAVHSEEGRPYACPLCSKRFKRSQDMNWHLKTHSNDKPNICDVCGKGFALKYVLNQHKKSHEVLEKKFFCSTCGKAYLFEKSLKIHERIHTGETYYKCDVCNETFVTHIKFKCHMQKKHSNNKNNIDKGLQHDGLINIVIT